MKHTVVWSGGMDSTLILLDLIKRNINVDAIVFETKQFGYRKDEFEETARTNIMKKIKKEINITKINISFDYSNVLGMHAGLFQQPTMITLLSVFGNDNTIYYLGYHKGDDFFSCEHDLLSASEHITSAMGRKHIKFSFPLRFSTKEGIVNSIRKYGMDSLCHFCENPTNSPTGRCGMCSACKTYADALQLIDFHNKRGFTQYANFDYEFDKENNYNG